MQPEHDYNPECNEEQDPQCKDEEFADLCLDEIEDWDDDFDIEHEPPGCAPVPDMACPLCGLDLSELDTMVRKNKRNDTIHLVLVANLSNFRFRPITDPRCSRQQMSGRHRSRAPDSSRTNRNTAIIT